MMKLSRRPRGAVPASRSDRDGSSIALVALEAGLAVLLSLALIWLVYQSGFSQRIEPAKAAAQPYISAFAPEDIKEAGAAYGSDRNFRWTTAHSVVLLPHVGYPYLLRFQAAGLRPGGTELPAVTVKSNLQEVARFNAANEFKLYSFRVDKPYFGPGLLTIEFDSATYQTGPGQPQVGLAIEWLEVSALNPAWPPPFGWLAVALAQGMLYGLVRLATRTTHNSRLWAGTVAGLAAGLLTLLLLDDFTGLPVRGNLLPVAGLITATGGCIFSWFRHFRYRRLLLVGVSWLWMLHAAYFYLAEGISEPLGWRRASQNWNEIAVLFSAAPLARLANPLLALSIGLAAGLALDLLLTLRWRAKYAAIWRNRVERLIIMTALGSGLTGMVVFFLGISGLLYSQALWALVVLLWGLALGRLMLLKPWTIKRAGLLNLGRNRLSAVRARPWLTGFYLTLAVTGLVYNWLFVVSSQTPDFGYDAAWYHLYQGRRFMEHHRLINMVSEYGNWPSGYPANQEMLYTLAYGLVGGSGLAQAFHWFNGVLLAAAIYMLARYYFSATVALCAAVIFTATPLTYALNITANNDLTLALYFILSLYSIQRLMTAADRRIALGWLVISAGLTGYLAGIKHLGMVAAALLAAGLLAFFFLKDYTFFRRKAGQQESGPDEDSPGLVVPAYKLWWPGRPWRTAFLMFGGLAGLVVAPWLARAWLDLGNPIYPALSPAIFSGQWWDARATEYLAEAHALYGVGHHPGNLLALPWTIPTGIKAYDGSSGPLYLCLVAPGIVWGLYNRAVRPVFAGWLLLVVVYTLIWFVQSHQLRYLFVIYPLLAIIGAYGIGQLIKPANNYTIKGYSLILKGLSGLAAVFLVLLVIVNLPVFANIRRDYLLPVNYRYLTGQESYARAISRGISPEVAWLNERLPAQSRVATTQSNLNQEFYTVPAVIPMHHGPPNADYRLDEGQLLNPRTFDNLRRLKITHLFLTAELRAQAESGPLKPYLGYIDNFNNKLFLYSFTPPAGQVSMTYRLYSARPA